MTEKRINLYHTLWLRRDSYGFALRPQHIQRYREYTSIYKEEEDERSIKWKIFLEHQVQPDQPISAEADDKQTAQAEDTEGKAKTVSEKNKEGGDSSGESDGSTECEPRKEVQLSKELKEEEQLSKELKEEKQPSGLHEEEVQPSKEPKEEVQPSKQPEDEVQPSEDPEEEIQLLKRHQEEEEPEEIPGNEGQLSEEPAKEEEPSVETHQKKVELVENPEKEGQLAEKPVKEEQRSEETHQKQVQPAENLEKEQKLLEEAAAKALPSEKIKEQLLKEPEKEGHLSKEGKAKEGHTWAQVRPSLGAIEIMMSCRVKKAKNMKDDQISAGGNHLPPIKELGSSVMETEDFEEEVSAHETKDDTTSDSPVNSPASEECSPEPFFPWKEELQFLVRGGVPKDLRGEVWQAFVGVKARRIERYYQDMLAKETDARESNEPANSSGVQKKWKRQIEKDIPRTFPGHPALNENGRESLKRILLAYAQHNPSVGYCQAMNFFAGILLLLMPEENAFWTLVGIIDDYFEGCYTEEMIESQVDQLVFEELMRERFPKLVNHLDYLGVQVAWISGPWFLSIFVNLLPWESVLRVWDVLLFEGNRAMLFRTALALMELYGPALVTTKDAGDAITLLQSLTGSTFDSSQLVLTACMGYLAVTEARLQQLREKHRPAVLVVVEERSKRGRVWKDSKGLASKLYSFKNDRGPLIHESKTNKCSDAPADGDKSQLEPPSSNLDQLLDGLSADAGADSLPDLQEQVVWLKVELCRLLEEKRTATLRAEELETALMEIVQEDNRRQLSARIEQLEQEVAELKQALADKREQETAMLQVLMRLEQEQRVTEDARRSAERDAAAQRYAVHVLEEKYEKAMVSVAQMEKRVVMAESMLEATLQYESSQAKALSSPRNEPGQVRALPFPGSKNNPGFYLESPRRRINLLPFGLGWRDRNRAKPAEESGDGRPTREGTDPSSTPKQTNPHESEPQ